MKRAGTGAAIYEIRRRIQEIQSELDSIGDFEDAPELIDLANLLHSNEYLNRKVQIQSELVQAYGEHSEALENLLTSVFEIQAALKDVLKEQSTLLSQTKKRTTARKNSVKHA